MQYTLALLGLAGYAAAVTSYSYHGSVPACGWTSTVISEAGATETVPIPMASAHCSSSAAPVSSSAPASSAAPYSSAPASSAAPVSSAPAPACSEYVDGQPQCSSVAPAPVCSEYVDGQPQCSSAAAPMSSSAAPMSSSAAAPVCSEYVDGQPQCSSAAPVSSSAAPVCSEYVDGQPQCATAAAVPSYGTGTGVAPVPSYTGPAIATGAAALPTAAPALLGAIGLLALL